MDREKYLITLALNPAFSPEEKEKGLPPVSRIKSQDWPDGWTNDRKMCQGKSSPRGRGHR